MYYSYVKNHKKLKSLLPTLEAGGMVDSKHGYIHMVKREAVSQRYFLIRDYTNGVLYRVSRNKILISTEKTHREINVGDEALKELDALIKLIVGRKRLFGKYFKSPATIFKILFLAVGILALIVNMEWIFK